MHYLKLPFDLFLPQLKKNESVLLLDFYQSLQTAYISSSEIWISHLSSLQIPPCENINKQTKNLLACSFILTEVTCGGLLVSVRNYSCKASVLKCIHLGVSFIEINVPGCRVNIIIVINTCMAPSVCIMFYRGKKNRIGLCSQGTYNLQLNKGENRGREAGRRPG